MVLHADHCPTALLGLGERQLQASHRQDAVVKLALAVRVVDQQHQAAARTRRSPLEHLQIPIGVAERSDRPPTDELLDGDRLALFVVEEIELSQANEYRHSVPHLVPQLPAASNHLLRRDPVKLLGYNTHEFVAAARDDVRSEPAGPKMTE